MRVSRWERYRVRRSNRSHMAETTIATVLVALVVVSFSVALYAVLTNR